MISLTEAWLSTSFLLPNYDSKSKRVEILIIIKGSPPATEHDSGWGVLAIDSTRTEPSRISLAVHKSISTERSCNGDHRSRTSAESTTNLKKIQSIHFTWLGSFHTHTMPSAPLQYLSHMERNLGCPYECDQEIPSKLDKIALSYLQHPISWALHSLSVLCESWTRLWVPHLHSTSEVWVGWSPS